MIQCTRTTSENKDFVKLVTELDFFLSGMNGDENAFYSQFNKIDSLPCVVVAYDGHTPVGCGAIKHYAPGWMEVKRMYVLPGRRGEGIASAVLESLEQWAMEQGYTGCLLETGTKLSAAIALYMKSGYHQIPNYGQYEHMENSKCFEKILAG